MDKKQRDQIAHATREFIRMGRLPIYISLSLLRYVCDKVKPSIQGMVDSLNEQQERLPTCGEMQYIRLFALQTRDRDGEPYDLRAIIDVEVFLVGELWKDIQYAACHRARG